MKNSILRGTLFILLLVSSGGSVLAQLQVGTINGTITDGTGAVIPGVDVSLSSVGVIGGTQQVITDERGTYRFVNLVPGTYTVKIEMPGFRTVVREGIGINADKTVRLDMTLEVGAVNDTVLVTGEAPLLDVTTALNQSVLDRKILDAIPTGGDLWSIGRLVPGVLTGNYDIGGTASFQQTSLTIHGGGDQKFAIDGMNVSWAGGSGGSTAIYYDVAMFEEVNYQVGNISAENKEGGVIMNMVTRTGTNNFKGDFFFWGVNSALQSENLSGKTKADLIAAVPARALAANPSLIPQNRILGMFDSGLSLSGPLKKDKLWWTASGKLNSLNQYQINTYNEDGTQGVDDNRILNWSTKVSWQINSKNQLHYSFNRNFKNRYHRRSGFTENRAAILQNQKGYTTQLKWTWTVTPKLFLDATAGYSFIDFPSRHQNEVKPGDIPRTDTSTSITTVAAGTYSLQPADRRIASASLSYFLGKHDLKAGWQFDEALEHSYTYSMSNFPSGLRARYNNGNPQDVTLYNSPTDERNYVRYNGGFIQDKWSLSRKITLNFGLRAEKTIGWVPASCFAGIPMAPWNIPAQCFKEIRNVPNWFDIAPRFSLVYDLFGDGKTAIKISANHYNNGIGSSHPGRVNPVSSTSRTVNWSDSNGDKIPQLTEISTATAEGWVFGTNNSYAPGIKRPTNDEYQIGFQQELPMGIVFMADYAHRDNWRSISSVNVAIPRGTEAYTPVQFTFPADPNNKMAGQTITVWNIKPEWNTATSKNVFDNHSHRQSYFDGIDFTATKRLSNRWMLLAGLSLNKSQNRDGVDLDSPNTRFTGGPTGSNVPVSFKMSGTYELPLGLSVSGNFQHFTGQPEGQTFRITRTNIPALTLTQLDITTAQTGTYQRPDVNLLDLSVKKEFRFGEDYRVAFHSDMFNLNNSSAIQGRTTQLGTTYGRISSVLAPRVFRLGLKTYF
jgi:hypothetical protein